MIRAIVAASLQGRFLVLAAAVALVAFGASRFGSMPIDVLPEFAPPTVEVQTEATGLSAEEVESLITVGLEELLSGVPWLESTRSRSVTGLSTITLTFNRGTDIVKARQMVHERLILDYKLPNVATPPVILQPVSTTSRFMMIELSSDKIEPTELSLLARWTIKPRLIGVPGVANVSIWGQRLRQLHVQVHPDRLRDARVVQDDIIAAAGDALWVSPLTFLKSSSASAGGWIDNPNQRIGVEHSMPIETPEDMAKVPVTPEPELRLGRTLPLGDVAELTFSHAPLIGDAYVNGGNGLLLVLEKFPSVSVTEVTRGVDTAIAELSRGLPGVKINSSVFRLASYIESSMMNLRTIALAGGVLALVVALLTLGSWRRAVVVVVTAVASMFTAITVLQVAGATLNAMMLSGLIVALAVVIDDVVAHVDAFRRHMQAADSGAIVPSGIVAVARESATRSFYAALIAIVSIVPIVYVGGLFGAFLEPFAAAYCVAIMASIAVALTLTPVLLMLLFGASVGGAAQTHDLRFGRRWRRASSITGDRASARLSDHASGRIAGSVDSAILRAARAPRAIFAAAATLVIGGVIAWIALDPSLVPPFREGVVVVDWSTPPGTSHVETQRITARASRELQGLPGVRSVAAHVGRAVTGDQVVGINDAQIWIGLDTTADERQTMASIEETLNGYPGVQHSSHGYLRDKVAKVLTGDNRPIVVRIYGPKRDVRRQKADEVQRAIAGIDGIVDSRVDGEVEEPQVQVRVNLDAAGRADVKPGDVRRASATVFSGIVVGYLFKAQKIFEVVVWGAPEARQSIANLRDVWIDKADRTRVRLRDVADVSIESTPTVIRHERIAPYIDVVAGVSGARVKDVATAVEAKVKGIAFPIEHRPELIGESFTRDHAGARALAVIVAAVIAIFLLLQACSGSWGLASVGFIALLPPVGAGVLVGAIGGGGLSLGSMLGLFGVLAIASRNTLVVIDRFRCADIASDPSMTTQTADAAIGIFPSLLAGTAVIVAAMLPLIAMGRPPGLEIAQPIALVITTGAIVSMLVSVFMLPALYRFLGSHPGTAHEPGLIEI